MFLTLRNERGSMAVERNDSVFPHLACEACRSGKLRCSGHRNGCQRCLARNLSCKYSVSNGRKNRKRRRVNNGSQPDWPVVSVERSISADPTDANHGSRVDRTDEVESRIRNANDTTATDILQGWIPASNLLLQGPLNDVLNFKRCPDSLVSTTVLNANNDTNPRNQAIVHLEFRYDFAPNHAPDSEHGELSTEILHTTATNKCPGLWPVASKIDSVCHSHIRPEDSQKQKHSRETDALVPETCDCMFSILRVSEALEIAKHQLELHLADHLLRAGKFGLAKCGKILECQSCTSNSSLMMLVVMVCRTMVSALEHLFMILTTQYEKLRRLGRRKTPRTASTTIDALESASDDEVGPLLTMGIVNVNDYEVDAVEEPCVFGGLATMQLRAVGRLMAQLKAKCAESNWESHTKISKTVEKRCQDKLAALRVYHDSHE